LYMGAGFARLERQRKSAGELPQSLLHARFGRALRFTDGGEHEVFDHRRVFLERFGLDRQLLEHLLAVDHGLDQTAAGAGFVALGGETFLHLAHLLLNLLRLLDQVAEALHRTLLPASPDGWITSPSNHAIARSTRGFRSAGRGRGAAWVSTEQRSS